MWPMPPRHGSSWGLICESEHCGVRDLQPDLVTDRLTRVGTPTLAVLALREWGVQAIVSARHVKVGFHAVVKSIRTITARRLHDPLHQRHSVTLTCRCAPRYGRLVHPQTSTRT